MKHSLCTAALALSLSIPGALLAQQTQPSDPAQGNTAAAPVGPPPHQHHHNPRHETAHLRKELNLSPDQAAKVEPILADRDQKMQALMDNPSLSPQDRHDQMRAIHQGTDQQLASVLSPDQMQQMKAMHHARHNGQPGTPDGGSPAPAESAPAPNQ